MEYDYPWYDAGWLKKYVQAKTIIRELYPEKLEEFICMTDILKTRSDFVTIKQDNLFTDKILHECKGIIEELTTGDFEKQELLQMGRLVVHDHPYFNKLQRTLVDFVSETVGEPVEMYYNFLSLYNNLGNLGVHMDAPEAKWTLDICIDQSDIWPIYLSQVQPWPEVFDYTENDWETCIKKDSVNHFSKYTLRVGDGIIFSGSAQWHYRNRIIQQGKNNYCHLIFFHFIPKGAREIINPSNWKQLLDIPEFTLLDTEFPDEFLFGHGISSLKPKTYP